ncbi:MAG: thioredoxin domain-containing protein [Cyclobacteriaceae bacterium]
MRKKVSKCQSVMSLMIVLLFLSCTPNKGQENGANALINESSPYLLQHAYNPVEWYPWGDEALSKAQKEDKLLVISIGYAACHWCHVMEHESFEDSLVAQKMNASFVSIKVDREERPDIDAIYMDAMQLIQRRGGWPLNVIALPDGRPVFAESYLPKKNWEKLLDVFSEMYQNDREKMLTQAEQVTEGVSQLEMAMFNDSGSDFTQENFDQLFENTIQSIDMRKGGREGAPKFPMPSIYEFLLTYDYFNSNPKAQQALKVTLDNMAFGGIYDQAGGGFARYSVDDKWIVPHFEKMLYDNSQLVSLYSHAYQYFGDAEYKRVVDETLEFVARELTDASGGFYSSLDADSEGVEGKFYVWTEEEIDAALGEKSKIFKTYYGVSHQGNFEEKNILVKTMSISELAQKFDLSIDNASSIVETGKKKLLEIRAGRVRPGLDDKILTSWNSLMITGYLDAYFAFGEDKYLESALNCGEFLLNNQIEKSGKINRNYKDGKSSISGFLDDYSHTIMAFIKLYEATFDEQWLYKAKELRDYVMKFFSDEETKMFFYTSDEDPELIARKMEITDNVIPSSNSSMAMALFQLGQYFFNEDDIARAKQMFANVEQEVLEVPHGYSNWARLYGLIGNRHYEVAVVGPDAQGKKLELATRFIPNKILMGGKDEGSLELLSGKLNPGSTMIYVCQNKSCQLPVTEAQKAIGQMGLD